MRRLRASVGLLVLCVGLNQACFAAGKEAADKGKPGAANTAKADASKGGEAKKLLSTMIVFEDKTSGVKISYPKDWKVEQPRNGTHIVRFKPADMQGMSVSLAAQDAYKNETLKEFVDETNEKAVKSGKESDIKVTIVKSKLAGQMAQSPAARTEMKYDLPPNPPLRGDTMTAIRGGRAYTMAFTAPASVHDVYVPIFDEMVKSLTITSAPAALKDRPRRMAIPAQLAH